MLRTQPRPAVRSNALRDHRIPHRVARLAHAPGSGDIARDSLVKKQRLNERSER
jgi:hypothetical protein